jgi:hypothetical protein
MSTKLSWSFVCVSRRVSSIPLRALRLFKWKEKTGAVDRVEEERGAGGAAAPGAPVSLIGRALFKKETDLGLFAGLTLHTRAGVAGVIEGAFGKAGKFKVTVARPDAAAPPRAGDALVLRYKKFLFTPRGVAGGAARGAFEQ